MTWEYSSLGRLRASSFPMLRKLRTCTSPATRLPGVLERMTGIEPAYSAWESVRAFTRRACVRGMLPGQRVFSGPTVLLAVVPGTSLFRVLLVVRR
jgi:hypothetical protein